MASSRAEHPAILGGRPAVPPGMIRKWSALGQTDREMVLASLNGDNHAFALNCEAFGSRGKAEPHKPVNVCTGDPMVCC